MLNKKAQASEAMAWLVVTLVIFILLGISLYAAGFLSKLKTAGHSDFSIQDRAMEESIFAYFLSENSGIREEIFSEMDTMGKDGKFYGDFDSKFRQIKFNLEKYGIQ